MSSVPRCVKVRQILRTLLIRVEERDVFMSRENQGRGIPSWWRGATLKCRRKVIWNIKAHLNCRVALMYTRHLPSFKLDQPAVEILAYKC